MRFFYDTEFIEDGVHIDLVSIGMVDESGREYYAINAQHDPAKAGPWVRRNVLEKLPSPSDPAWKSRDRIRDELAEFLTAPGEPIELWAWVAAYDHVAFCQLWGDMRALPKGVPRFTHELKQRWEDLGSPALPPADPDAHHALVDARTNLERWKIMHALGSWPRTPSAG